MSFLIPKNLLFLLVKLLRALLLLPYFWLQCHVLTQDNPLCVWSRADFEGAFPISKDAPLQELLFQVEERHGIAAVKQRCETCRSGSLCGPDPAREQAIDLR